MIILRKLFSKKSEAYNDIDENVPDDPYYENLIDKLSKKAAIGGAGVTGTGVMIDLVGKKRGAKEGEKALEKISKLKNKIKSAEFLSEDHFGHEGESGFFGEELKKRQERSNKQIKKATNEINKISKDSKKVIKAAKLSRKGKSIVAAGTTLAAIGGTGYLMNKLAKNARRSSKKDLKDVLVQSKK